MKSSYKYLLVVGIMSVGLWLITDHFLNSTSNSVRPLTVREVAYLRDKQMRESAEAHSPRQQQETDKPTRTAASQHQDRALSVKQRVVAPHPAIEADNVAESPAETEPLIAQQTDDSPDTNENTTQASGAVTPGADGGEQSTTVASTRADSDADIQQRARSEQQARVSDTPAPVSTRKPVRKATEQELLAMLEQDSLTAALPTRAVDITLRVNSDSCVQPVQERTRIGIKFRQGSAAIKGSSLSRIDRLVDAYRSCTGGKLLLEHNPEGLTDANDLLRQRRQDEVKYYLLQRRVPKSAIHYPESS